MADLPFTLDQLRILRAIVSEGSFKKAADSLYVTQPAVSLQIQNLEKQLEVSLFDRGGRKAQLTEAGHLLLSYCDRILSQCHEACRALDDLHNLKGGSLIVGASQTTGTYLMPRMIGLFPAEVSGCGSPAPGAQHPSDWLERGQWSDRSGDHRWRTAA